MQEKKIWKPSPNEVCPECASRFYISSIIPQNGQVNFACIQSDCPCMGFIHNGMIYFSVTKVHEES